MSLDISLHEKRLTPPTEFDTLGAEVVSMNWLRNPYGLCNWAEDNFEALGMKVAKNESLWYVINHWNYEKAPKVNRVLFKSVVDQYWRVIQKIDKGYFFFDINAYMQFVEPHVDLLPKERIEILHENRIKGLNHELKHHVGIPMEYFNLECFNLGIEKFKTPLEHYKNWFLELVQFADKLQDKSLTFYCSN